MGNVNQLSVSINCNRGYFKVARHIRACLRKECHLSGISIIEKKNGCDMVVIICHSRDIKDGRLNRIKETAELVASGSGQTIVVIKKLR